MNGPFAFSEACINSLCHMIQKKKNYLQINACRFLFINTASHVCNLMIPKNRRFTSWVKIIRILQVQMDKNNMKVRARKWILGFTLRGREYLLLILQCQKKKDKQLPRKLHSTNENYGLILSNWFTFYSVALISTVSEKPRWFPRGEKNPESDGN